MGRRETPLSVKLLLFFLFLLGITLNILIILDVTWLNLYLIQGGRVPGGGGGGGGGELTGTDPGAEPELDRLRESILLVLVPTCDGSGLSSGTGFVIKPGYVATAAHVIGDHYACDSEIQLVDSFEVEHAAVADGYSGDDDLALLQISDTSIPQLPLADSRQFQEVNQTLKVVTIGYPLIGAASSLESSAVSGEGNISNFDTDKNRFITSGLNVNPGNSGGPVFLVEEGWPVIGVASAKLDVTVGEGIGYIVPVDVLKRFFFDTTGETLE